MKVDATDLQSEIKTGLKDILPAGKESNALIWGFCKGLASRLNKEWREYDRRREKEAENDQKWDVNSKIQEFLDNPMPREEEAKMLRAIFHAGLSTGEINAQFLEKYDKIVGVQPEEDSKMELVDFSTAFPDLATAIAICMKPQPEIENEEN